MIKYSFEQKKALVTAYLNGEGGIRTVIKKYGYSNRSQLQRWIVAYQMYGDDGLKISQKTFNYSFEKKLNEQRIKEKLGWMSPVEYRLTHLAA
ncbi:MAG: helix-turn-helix domain-containing protein [Lachnospiraceae bacterium]